MGERHVEFSLNVTEFGWEIMKKYIHELDVVRTPIGTYITLLIPESVVKKHGGSVPDDGECDE